MKVYVKDPEVVTAIQYTGKNKIDVAKWVTETNETDQRPIHIDVTYLSLRFIEDPNDGITVNEGDWIVRTSDGHYKVVNGEEFKEHYKAATISA